MAAYDTVPAVFVHVYHAELQRQIAQRESRLRTAVRTRTIQGKTDNWDRLGPSDLAAIATRHATTTILDPIHSRRRAVMSDRGGAIILDRHDEVKMIAQPQNEYAQNHADSINRFYDDLIISALGGSATAVAADDTTSTVTLPAGQIVAEAGTAGLTFAKVNRAVELLNAKDVPFDNRYAVVSAAGLSDLLATTQATSSDFVDLKAIQSGRLEGTFMGFTWIMSNRLPFTTPKRTNYFFHKNAVGLSMAMDMYTSVSTRHDLNDATQVYAACSAGAVRIEEELVVAVEIDEVTG
jgi:Phage capsid protein